MLIVYSNTHAEQVYNDISSVLSARILVQVAVLFAGVSCKIIISFFGCCFSIGAHECAFQNSVESPDSALQFQLLLFCHVWLSPVYVSLLLPRGFLIKFCLVIQLMKRLVKKPLGWCSCSLLYVNACCNFFQSRGVESAGDQSLRTSHGCFTEAVRGIG